MFRLAVAKASIVPSRLCCGVVLWHVQRWSGLVSIALQKAIALQAALPEGADLISVHATRALHRQFVPSPADAGGGVPASLRGAVPEAAEPMAVREAVKFAGRGVRRNDRRPKSTPVCPPP